ncbi:MAG: 2Fe-2S iron-sulfur cluster binding domain-containing protein [Actinomycetota bacterium]|nr:MAG: 2Fe-2S iron-sulfur cluster binding domain-containing protein [Actinomycetota bacterium]
MTVSIQRNLKISVNGVEVSAPEGFTILQACRNEGIDIPTLCYLENLTPVNTCRLCMVEVEGSRTLVPACSRKIEAGMVIRTESDRVSRSRKMILELLASSVDMSIVSAELASWMALYEVDKERFGPLTASGIDGELEKMHAGHHHKPDGNSASTVAQPAKIDNDQYIRDYSRCVLCYKCVEACGTDAQNTFAIAVGGRGFEAHITTEFGVPLPESACVYCGNCIAVCPTSALMFKIEYDLRQESKWDESRQTITRTICPYCGVGCNLEIHAQDNRIVKVTSPMDHDVTKGMLCVKGRFGFEFLNG